MLLTLSSLTPCLDLLELETELSGARQDVKKIFDIESSSRSQIYWWSFTESLDTTLLRVNDDNMHKVLMASVGRWIPTQDQDIQDGID